MASSQCEAVRPLILRAADGALEGAERAQLEAHLASCEECRLAAFSQAAVRRLLIGLPLEPASDDFASRVRARVEPRAGLLDLLNWRAWTLRIAPVAAMLGLLAWMSTSTEASSNVSDAVEAWASGGGGGTPAALLIAEEVDRDQLLAAALEGGSQ